ncbi:MAG: FAD binding domain-containing protein [Planctomycetota bacterium]
MNRFAYAAAASLEDAARKLAEGGTLKAGGVDLLGRIKRGTLAPSLLVDVDRLEPLTGFRDDDDRSWLLGANVRLADLADAGLYEGARRELAGLREAAAGAATPQVRNRATLAGNLLQSGRCWYLHDAEVACAGKGGEGCPALEGRNEQHAILGWTDCPVTMGSNLAPMLCALDAVLGLRLPGDQVGLKRLREVYPGPAKGDAFRLHALPDGAIVESVRIPRTGASTAHVEVRHKRSYDWALTIASVALRLEGGRIAAPSCWLGSVAPRPWHAKAAEEAVAGKEPSRGLFEEAAAAIVCRPLSEGAYKVDMTRHALVEALLLACDRAREAGR